MEYYAKSPTTNQQKKRRLLSEEIERFLVYAKDDLNEEESVLFQSYIGNLKKDQPIEHKLLAEHLRETVRCAEDFFRIYGEYFSDKEKQLVLKACADHDLGKVNYIFQTMVNPYLEKISGMRQIPHGFLSAFALSKQEFLKEYPDCTEDDFRVLLTAIYYHHTRPDDFQSKEMKAYCNQYYKHYLSEYLSKYKNIDTEKDKLYSISNRNKLLFSIDRIQKYKSELVTENVWCEYMLVKGLLNKFDWTVSGGYDSAEVNTDKNDKNLCHSIENKIAGKLRPAQQFMKEHKDDNLIVVAPTGSGKTEAALLWLNGEKGFYTLPLKVSSNAIYNRIKQCYNFETVAILHSDSMNSFIEASDNDLEKGYRNYEQAKLFAYPLTICTVDQLFLFVYKALGTEIFAATLKYSKLIIDEIQAYSPRIVAALLFGLSEIKSMGGKFAIITATFPPVLEYFMREYKLISSGDYLYRDFSDTADKVRHRIRIHDRGFNIGEIIENGADKKVLVICNTVSQAQAVYQEIKKRFEHAWLLHSRYIRKHRTILENNIMKFSEDKEAVGIWVTTQIVEASLDIDFDLLYTEMCTADSLLQRMGRCNRAGKKEMKTPNIIICNCGSSKYKKIYDEDIYNDSLDSLRRFDGRPFSESDKVSYINEVYAVEKIRNTKYFKEIQDNIDFFKGLKPLECDIKEARKDFRAIHSITVIPENIYRDNQEIIECIDNFLKNGDVDARVRKILKNKLAELTLSVNLYYQFPDGIDKTATFLDVHRARLKYDFDDEKGVGLGLSLDKIEEEDFFV